MEINYDVVNASHFGQQTCGLLYSADKINSQFSLNVSGYPEKIDLVMIS
jgi:hypothetical protein